MAKTSSTTNTSVAQLGEGILTIGATAKSVKGGTAELNTALGILANNGIKGAEGGTHLRNVILELQNPTDKASALMKKNVLNDWFRRREMRIVVIRHGESEADIKYPKIDNLPIDKSVYGQETRVDFRKRAEIAFERIIKENDSDTTVAIVSHGGMINQLYHVFLGLPIESKIFFGTGDTGIHEWILKEERYILKANLLEHIMEIK